MLVSQIQGNNPPRLYAIRANIISSDWDCDSNLDLFYSRSVIRDYNGQNTAGHNRPFSNLAAWHLCFLSKPQRTMERISSALHFLGSDSGDRD
jgi:hypothetical protein